MSKEKVLLVEDEVDLLNLLTFILTEAGYETSFATRGDEVIQRAREFDPDLVILDIGLPGLSGLDVCPLLVTMDIPVLVLSSHDKDEQIIEGLEVGAEDYVSKPFNHKELLLRVEKIIRRTKPELIEEHLVVGALTVDLKRSVVEIEGNEIALTPTEYKIVSFLALHAHTPVSTETLLKHVWKSEEWIQGPEMVKVNISRLRKKLEADPAHPRFLLNRWGFGYLLTDTQRAEGEGL